MSNQAEPQSQFWQTDERLVNAAKEFEQMNAAAQQEADAVESLNESLSEEASIDVPGSSFWGDNESEEPQAEPEEPVMEAAAETDDIPENSDDQIIKVKAYGKEIELGMEDAAKRLGVDKDVLSQLPREAVSSALSKIEGANKAFKKAADVNKRLKDLESKYQAAEQKAKLLDKLEEVKHDWKAIVQIATGKDPEQFLAEAMKKQRILETGTEQEKAQLEREERVAELERKLQLQAEKQKEIEEAEKSRSYNSEKEQLKSLLESEFHKHKFELDNEVDSNDVNELLWQQSQARMKQYVKKYQDHPKFNELLPKMAQKSFDDVASKLKRLTTAQVQAKVDQAIQNKKKQAAEKAAVTASSRPSQDLKASDFKGLGVREMADRLLGKKTFSW